MKSGLSASEPISVIQLGAARFLKPAVSLGRAPRRQLGRFLPVCFRVAVWAKRSRPWSLFWVRYQESIRAGFCETSMAISRLRDSLSLAMTDSG